MKKSYNWLMWPLAILAVGAIAWFGIGQLDSLESSQDDNIRGVATVYKSPTCGCCVNYVSLLEKRGYKVEVKEMEDMSSIKDKFDIPANMESCHTTIIDDYVIEGHMPFELVEQLLTEKPDINGIALPNMPAGSPGMPGFKSGKWTVYSLTDSGTEVFTKY